LRRADFTMLSLVNRTQARREIGAPQRGPAIDG